MRSIARAATCLRSYWTFPASGFVQFRYPRQLEMGGPEQVTCPDSTEGAFLPPLKRPLTLCLLSCLQTGIFDLESGDFAIDNSHVAQ